VPAAQQRFVVGLQDWDAIDTKALGVLATAVAALAALAAAHHTLNPLWWLPAVALGVACLLLAGTQAGGWSIESGSGCAAVEGSSCDG
jgi:hypothetical protein